MGFSRLLAMKFGFRWHKATGEPVIPIRLNKLQAIP
jgi:hypothetical protein